jgi:hypothetical protein
MQLLSRETSPEEKLRPRSFCWELWEYGSVTAQRWRS